MGYRSIQLAPDNKGTSIPPEACMITQCLGIKNKKISTRFTGFYSKGLYSRTPVDIKLRVEIADKDGNIVGRLSTDKPLKTDQSYCVELSKVLDLLGLKGDFYGQVVMSLEPVGLRSSDLEQYVSTYSLSSTDVCIEYYSDRFYTSVQHSGINPANHLSRRKHHGITMYSPKVFITEKVETYLALIHPTTDPDYDFPAVADIKVLTPDGKSIERRTSPIPARGVYFVNVDHVFEGDARELLRPFGGLGTLKAKTDGQVLMPLVFNHNTVSGAWMIDHTRPAFLEIFEGYKGERHLQMANSLRYQIAHNLIASLPLALRERFKKMPLRPLRNLLGA